MPTEPLRAPTAAEMQAVMKSLNEARNHLDLLTFGAPQEFRNALYPLHDCIEALEKAEKGEPCMATETYPQRYVDALNKEIASLREAHGGAILAQASAVERMEKAEAELRQWHAISNEFAARRNKAESKAADLRDLIVEMRSWNKLTEIEIGNLRSVCKDEADENDAIRQKLLKLCVDCGWDVAQDCRTLDLADWLSDNVPRATLPVRVQRATWTKDVPIQSGLYWWWNEDEDSLPLPVHIGWSGHDGKCFAQVGQYGWTRHQEVEEMGGYWMRLDEPARPDASNREGGGGGGVEVGDPNGESESRANGHNTEIINLHRVIDEVSTNLRAERDAALAKLDEREAQLAAARAALSGLLDEYDDRKAQWGDEYLWSKHESPEIIAVARAAIDSAKEAK